MVSIMCSWYMTVYREFASSYDPIFFWKMKRPFLVQKVERSSVQNFIQPWDTVVYNVSLVWLQKRLHVHTTPFLSEIRGRRGFILQWMWHMLWNWYCNMTIDYFGCRYTSVHKSWKYTVTCLDDCRTWITTRVQPFIYIFVIQYPIA